jgi:PAS domain-containing protein
MLISPGKVLERTERFEAPQSAEGRYRMLVEAVTDYAIYMLDPTGIVSSWNPGARRFKGYRTARRSCRGGRLRQRNAKAIRNRRLARPQGRQSVLGLCHHRSHPRQRRQAGWFCKGYAST